VDPAPSLATIPVTARLPWDHIDVGLEEGFLAKEYRKALKSRLSPPCGKVVGAFVHATNVADAEAEKRKLVCYDCGVACDLTAMREERLVFLRKLGAYTPTPVRERDPADAAPRRRRPPPAVDRGVPVRVRVRFTKLGRAAFGSHLDLVRVLPRILRRAGLALFYSQGFHPKPEMTFAPALSLGISSLDEHVDVKLAHDSVVEPSVLVERLRRASIEGIQILDARVLGPEDASVSRVIDEARYVAALPRAAFEALGIAPGDLDALRARVEARRSGPLEVRRTIDGIGRTIDVGAYLVGIDVGAGGEALAEAGLTGELWPVAISLRITGSGTAKPTEALEALVGAPSSELPVRLVRAALGARRGDRLVPPLELEALRRPRSPRDASSGDSDATVESATSEASPPARAPALALAPPEEP